MIHLPHLITDLGFILVIAALSTLLFKKLGQPLVLGYLIAGFLVSPHVPFLPTVTDNESIKVWSEIGVIFLLFSLGLEFSFKKLFKVGGSAGFTAVFEVLFMVALGYGVGLLLDWSSIDSLFFGGILSISSTTIIVRAFQELGLKGQKFVDVVFGILVVEDIVAILLLVLLSAIAGTEAFSGTRLVVEGLRLVFFMALWFVVGIFFIPLFLRKIRSLLEDETTLLIAIGLCFAMVMIAAQVGFSPALGAFVMGSLLAETPEGHKMEHLLQPVKNLFAAIFFVSVGMMIDPRVLSQYWGLILLVTAVTIVGKFVSTFLGALFSGQSRKMAFQAGMSLAQIGEFSFIIASLGVSLKVTSDFLYPLAIAVSAVTTFTTPYLIKVADRLYPWVEAKIPDSLKNHMDNYHASFTQQGRQGMGSLLLKTYGLNILLNSVLIVAILGAFKAVVIDKVRALLPDGHWAQSSSLLLCLLLTAPFFWGLIMGGPSLRTEREVSELKKLKRMQAGLFIGRVLLGLILLSAILIQFVTLKTASAVLVGGLFFASILGQGWVRRLYQNLEKSFLKNLTEKERQELGTVDVTKHFLPWETTLESYEITADMALVGRSLKEQNFKEKYGVTVAAVFRGQRRFLAPKGDFVLWPHDKMICFGSEEELKRLHGVLEEQQSAFWAEEVNRQEDFNLQALAVDVESPYKDKTIRECGIRESHLGMIVGVERGRERILGPSGDFKIQENDLLWIVSDNLNK